MERGEVANGSGVAPESLADVVSRGPDDPYADQGAASIDSPAVVNPMLRDSLAMRARAWWKDASEHPLWKDFIAQSKEDLGFYVGGRGQWSYDNNFEDYDKLRRAGRAVISINHVQAVVDVMTGYERQNRVDIKTAPQGNEDSESAELMSLLLKFEQDKAGVPDLITEMFEEGTITGLDCLDVGIDYTGEDPLDGVIDCKRLRPGRDVIWDPWWNDYGANDSRYFLKWKWAFEMDAVAEYPEHAEAIRDGITQLYTAWSSASSTSDNKGMAGGAYGTVRGHPVESLSDEALFWDKSTRRILILEVWYRIYDSKWIVVDQDLGTVFGKDEEGDDEWDRADATAYVKGQVEAGMPKDRFRAIELKSRKVRMGTVIPATYVVIEEDKNPYENDDREYPFAVYRAKKKGDIVYGVVRNLKDPQRVENKRISQCLDIIARYANIRPLVPKGSLVDVSVLQDHTDAPLVVDYSKVPGGQKIEWLVPPLAEIAKVLTDLALTMKINMREVSGINTELLGTENDVKSGIAIARRQAQGQVITTLFFDNLRRTRKFIGQRLARRIQQVYSREKFVRLTNSLGQPMVIRVNPQELKGQRKSLSQEALRAKVQEVEKQGQPRVLVDIDALKYDVIISEAPSTPTARASARQDLMEIVKEIPMIGPLVLDVLLELSDIPDRATIVARAKASMPPALQNPGAPPPIDPATGQPVVPQGAPPAGPGGQPMVVNDTNRMPVAPPPVAPTPKPV